MLPRSTAFLLLGVLRVLPNKELLYEEILVYPYSSSRYMLSSCLSGKSGVSPKTIKERRKLSWQQNLNLRHLSSNRWLTARYAGWSRYRVGQSYR